MITWKQRQDAIEVAQQTAVENIHVHGRDKRYVTMGVHTLKALISMAVNAALDTVENNDTARH